MCEALLGHLRSSLRIYELVIDISCVSAADARSAFAVIRHRHRDEATRAMHVILGQFWKIARELAGHLIAAVIVMVAFGFLQAAHQLALYHVAAICMSMKRALLERADEVPIFVVAVCVVRMGHVVRCVTVQHQLGVVHGHGVVYETCSYRQRHSERGNNQKPQVAAALLVAFQ